MSFLSKYRYINPKKLGAVILFLISFFNQPLLSIWTLVMCLKGVISRERSTAISIFIMIQLRTLINPGIASSYSGVSSIIKWITIFILSLVILATMSDEHANVLNRVYLSFIFFTVLVVVSGFLFSSYPVVAAFKMISYVVPFLAILKGICNANYIDWIKKIIEPLGALLIGSIVLIPFPVGYLRNGHAFQGFFNHPNVYGVMLAMFLAGFLYSSNKITLKEIIVSIMTTGLAVLSESRTGIFSCVFSIILYLLSKEIRTKSSSKIYLIIIILTIVSIMVLDKSIMTSIYSIIYKGGNESVLFSRANQFEANVSRFFASPLLGTGFNVPYVPNVCSYGFSFDLVVENGNLILAILGDTGIIGFIMFILCYLRLLKLGWGNKIVLFIIPFVVSMGEQSFFSTNNFAIIMYIYISIFVADGLKEINLDENKYLQEF